MKEEWEEGSSIRREMKGRKGMEEGGEGNGMIK